MHTVLWRSNVTHPHASGCRGHGANGATAARVRSYGKVLHRQASVFPQLPKDVRSEGTRRISLLRIHFDHHAPVNRRGKVGVVASATKGGFVPLDDGGEETVRGKAGEAERINQIDFTHPA